jgi:hypothetical protein
MTAACTHAGRASCQLPPGARPGAGAPHVTVPNRELELEGRKVAKRAQAARAPCRDLEVPRKWRAAVGAGKWYIKASGSVRVQVSLSPNRKVRFRFNFRGECAHTPRDFSAPDKLPML